MSVAGHLAIELDEYDDRIRTFVPGYDAMLAVAAAALRSVNTPAPLIVDLGIGTGALAARCVDVRPDARLHGVDQDPAILDAARRRLAASGVPIELATGSFLDVALPPCDAIVASLALHHIPTAVDKRQFYAACRAALRPGGLLVSADCFPATDPAFAAAHRLAWLDHLEQSYPRDDGERYLATWAGEDVYFPLADELSWIAGAGLAPEVLWRDGGFAVVAARAPG